MSKSVFRYSTYFNVAVSAAYLIWTTMLFYGMQRMYAAFRLHKQYCYIRYSYIIELILLQSKH